jgi:hypothetical protein
MDPALNARKHRDPGDAAATVPEGSALSRPTPPPEATAAEASATSPAASPVGAPCGSRRKRRPKFVL